jgi:hypothetical protein
LRDLNKAPEEDLETGEAGGTLHGDRDDEFMERTVQLSAKNKQPRHPRPAQSPVSGNRKSGIYAASEFDPEQDGSEDGLRGSFQKTSKFPDLSAELAIGYYKFPDRPASGKPRAKPRPFVYVPSKLMKDDDFAIEDVFDAIGLDPPSIIFRLNSANDPVTWNMRLPPSRYELASFQYIMDHDPDHDKIADEIIKDIVFKKQKQDNGNENVGSGNMAHGNGNETPSPQAEPAKNDHNEWFKLFEKRKNKGKTETASLMDVANNCAAISHYHGVIREKCKRLLKGTYAACEQAGAMFRIDELWSEDCRRDVIAEWLTSNHREENVRLLGIGDITSLHVDVRAGLLEKAASYVEKKKGRHTVDIGKTSVNKTLYQLAEEMEEDAFMLPREVVFGFELAEHIKTLLAQIEEKSSGENPSIKLNNGYWKTAFYEKDEKSKRDQGKSFHAPFETAAHLKDYKEVQVCEALIKELRSDLDAYLHAMLSMKILPDQQQLQQGNIKYDYDIEDEQREGCDQYLPTEHVLYNTHIVDWTDEEMRARFWEIYSIFHDWSDKSKSDARKAFMEEFNKHLEKPLRTVPLRTKMDAVPSIKGVKKGSFPHRGVTHMILTDDIDLLEQRLLEVSPWGGIFINGGEFSADLAVDCIQQGRPLIPVKYTGGTADLVVGMLEKRKFFLQARKIDPDYPFSESEIAYSVKMPDEGWIEKDWLKAFDKSHTTTAVKMNVLLENWPDRFSEASIFIVDTFHTTEDDVQDRITQTMGVVFESAHELGGSVSEQKRLTYAWRLRHKFLYNANIYKFISDVLMILITLLGFASVLSAVLYSAFAINPNWNSVSFDQTQMILQFGNLLLPLLATIVRGIFASVSPMLKYVALQNACVQVESEIYMYRTKVGKYGFRKRGGGGDKDKKKDEDKDGGKDGDKGGDKGGGGGGGEKSQKSSKQASNNPRKAFFSALDHIWNELSASDVQNGSLRTPISIGDQGPLEDINRRIKSNREEQDNYLTILASGRPKDQKKEKKEKKTEMNDEDQKLEERIKQFQVKAATKKLYLQQSHGSAEQAEDMDNDGHNGDNKNKDSRETYIDWMKRQISQLRKPNMETWQGRFTAIFISWWAVHLFTLLEEMYKQYLTQKLMAEQALKAAIDITASKKFITDDGLSTLSADQYVRIRLLPIAASFTQKAPGLSTQIQASATIGVVLSVASSALSTVNASVFIPALLSFSGALTAWINYKQIELRLLQTNAAINKLNQVRLCLLCLASASRFLPTLFLPPPSRPSSHLQLLVWWDSLTMIEKRVPQHKETLVKTCEETIQAQATIFSGGGARKSDGEDDEGGGDDSKAGDKKGSGK